MTKRYFLGWDIGGAHLKAVLLNENGEVQQVLQLSCPLWKGLSYLESSIYDALQAFKIEPSKAEGFNVRHAVTMTGELVDLFENRAQGVLKIANLATKLLGEDTFFYAANLPNQNHGSNQNNVFVRLERVSVLWASIASANWHASASALAKQVSDVLFIDIGSTTTDIIAIENGKVKSISLSDATRMADDSLVYTGVVRTPVMALAQKLPFENGETNVAAEYFATMADVYRLTGELLPEFDLSETADGKAKDLLASARRLARMIGYDAESRPIDTWKNLANTCKNMQITQIKTAVQKHLKAGVPMPNIVIGAGAGSFLVKQIADDLNCEFMHASKLISMRLPDHINVDLKALETCFTAFAVALLAQKTAGLHA